MHSAAELLVLAVSYRHSTARHSTARHSTARHARNGLVITYPDAGEQVVALVAEALLCYAEAFGVLELAPWNGRPYNDDKPDGPMRELVFGANGEGTVTSDLGGPAAGGCAARAVDRLIPLGLTATNDNG